MPLILTRSEVLSVYAEAAARRWVHPSFSTENLTTTEAILSAAREYGERSGQPDFAIAIAITHRYPERPQTSAYSHTGDPILGMRLFQADLRALMATGSPFAQLRVLVHLDHGLFDRDGDVLDTPSGAFSSVMFDASALPFAENIEATRRYVQQHHDEVVIEGACDTVAHSGESGTTPCTPPDDAERFYRATGVDWVVANLGTEHRAGVSKLSYRDDVAREISRRIGPRLSLHGTSSVLPEKLGRLYEDGVGKVNFWTALERDSAAEVFVALTEHAAEAAGPVTARRLLERDLLGAHADVSSAVSLEYCTTRYRQGIAFESMKRIVGSYLARWCPATRVEGSVEWRNT
jgi:fructose/tagatose bisphosphate aldolase